MLYFIHCGIPRVDTRYYEILNAKYINYKRSELLKHFSVNPMKDNITQTI